MNGLSSGPSRLAPVGWFDAVEGHRGWFVGLGVAMLVLGVLAIAVPFLATLASVLFLGWILLIGAVAQIVHAVQHRKRHGDGWIAVSAILYAVAGVLILANPLAGTVTLTFILAIFFIVEGIIKVVRSMAHRDMPRWGFLLFDGIVSLALGILILAHWPSAAVWAIGLLVGVDLVVGGWSMLLLSATAGARTRLPA